MLFHSIFQQRIFLVATLLNACLAFPRIISIPDLHGDYERAVQILQAAGLVNIKTGAWSGGTATLVQTGDIVDRGPDSTKIYKLFARLAAEAPKQGGEVINILGNHELMNIKGDLRYVSSKEMQKAGGRSRWQALWQANAQIGQQVRKFKTAVKVGHVLFVHAGLLPKFLKNGHTLDDVNRGMSDALDGKGDDVRDLTGDSGPLWTRFYAGSDQEQICKTVSQVLKQVGAERMVVGHTIQERVEGNRKVNRVNAACGGSLILADTGISRVYNGEMSFISYGTKKGDVVNYPGLGIQEVLPRSPLSPLLSGKVIAERSGPGPNAAPPQRLNLVPAIVPGTYGALWISQAFFKAYFAISIMCIGAIFFLLRPWIQRQFGKAMLKFRST